MKQITIPEALDWMGQMLKGIGCTVPIGLTGLVNIKTGSRQSTCTAFAGLRETSAWNSLGRIVSGFVREMDYLNL